MFERQKDVRPLPWVERICMAVVIFAIAFLVTVGILAHKARAEWHGEPGPYSGWFKSQMQDNAHVVDGPDGERHMGVSSCCGDEEHYGGDGRFVRVKSAGDGQHYFVWIEELQDWVLCPLIPKWHENPTGQNVIWIKTQVEAGHLSITWFCIRLAEGA